MSSSRTMMLEHLCNAFGDVALEIDVFWALDDGDALECLGGFYLALDLMEEEAHFIHFLP